MKILVVGGGGREHALVWKLSQSPLAEKIFCAPGNAGTAEIAETVVIKADDLDGICKFVEEQQIDLTVIGPEAPLTAGLADRLAAAGHKVFGPQKVAAQLEGSKEFAKDLLKKYAIPTAAYECFSDLSEALRYIESAPLPMVIKADGLAAGKGVVIAEDMATAKQTAADMLEGNIFGSAGSRIVVEEFLSGEEVSILAFCDGEHIVPMVSAQDHKRAYDNDAGPNTGGMGAYSPAPVYTPELAKFVGKHILQATLAALKAEGIIYKGILYAGLMITNKGPQVLEFNCRFGDPETQAVLARLESDLVEIMLSVIDGTLDAAEMIWSEKSSVCVVVAAGGYPDSYEKGDIINGLDAAAKTGATVFHAGTKISGNDIVTDGGRVLSITALGDNTAAAIANAYEAAAKIDIKNAFYRRDIGKKALNR